MDLLLTVRSLYWDSLRPLKVITLLMYPLAALGLYWSWAKDMADARLMFTLVDAPDYCHLWVWSFAIAYVAVARFIGLFVWHGNAFTARTTPIVGVVFWSMLAASNFAIPSQLAFGPMFLIPACMEGWILSRAWMEAY